MRQIVCVMTLFFYLAAYPYLVLAEGLSPNPDYQETFQYYYQKSLTSYQAHKNKQARHYIEFADIYAQTPSEKDSVEKMRRQLEPGRPLAPVVVPQPESPSLILPISKPLTPLVELKPAAVPRFEDIINFNDLKSASQQNRRLRIVLNSAVTIEGGPFLRFLVVDQGFLDVRLINQKQMRIQALKYGHTYLHIWDESGRTTVYVEIVLPKTSSEIVAIAPQKLVHTPPFKFTYSNDWSAYYTGDSVPDMQRESVNFLQYIGTEGETPYGVLDASATLRGFDELEDVPNYTLGLSHIPTAVTSDWSVRGFDGQKSLSPLSLPGTYLRGFFNDMYFMEDQLGLSYSYGRQQSTFGLLSQGTAETLDIYVQAAQLSLFPKDKNTHYEINFATGDGQDRASYLTKKSFSIEGQQKIDKLTLNAELARNDDEHNAVLSGLRWEDQGLRTGLNVRNINKEYTTVVSAPSNQGEIGATWISNLDNEHVSAQTVLDMYRNRLYFNPLDDDAVNIDSSANMRIPISSRFWDEADMYYVHTPGEVSPRRSFGINDRLSYHFDTWNTRKGTLYGGGGYQKSRYSFADASEYDRYALVAGFNFPLTNDLSYKASYEFSWLHEPFTNADYNPNVFSTGINYARQFNEQIQGNFGFDYRNEDGVEGTNSFLAGEDSMAAFMSLNYNPARDVSFFTDSRLRRVWPQIGQNPAYYDLDLRVGMRMALGMPIRWEPSGTVSGYVYKDKNLNGQKDAGEQGLGQVKVMVGEKEVETNDDGWYYADVKGQKVFISPQSESIPQGFIYSTPESKDNTIRQGHIIVADFGLNSQTSIVGTVFIDQNNNGKPDAGDEHVAKVNLILDGTMTQVSDNRGAYYFRNISDGTHHLELDIRSLPIHLIPLVKLKNEIIVQEGTTYSFHIPMRIKEEQGNEP